ncbi:hypothetical protein HID58_007909 [Brassica napus]|uniref:RNA helicase n=1 Tax=Brassica napus TaxID=3708 RepID=A0ABQ7XKD1_BRANA|nr:hypothetical protein HID58_007909 [Brassica napus]
MASCFSPLSLDNPFFSSPISLRTTRLIHSFRRRLATPNSVLSEEAFKSLGLSDNGSEEDDGEELAISKLGLPQRLGESLEKRGITHLFPIQGCAGPALQGRDIIARAKTGTGKTLAFELAKQVEKEIKESAPYLSTVCVYGGVSYTIQQSALTRGVDVVVGTPGRIIDLIEGRSLKLGEVEYLVLDEADQMLAVGFEEAVESILENLPQKRQSMLFSATMPAWVKKLARKYLDSPLNIDLVGDQDEKLAEGIKLYAISATSTSKRTILSDLITVYAKGGKTIVFTQTKRDADEYSFRGTSRRYLSASKRENTQRFSPRKFTVLVATDVASRGLDIPNVDLVIHYELPNDPETFVHRSGRTGRAGKEGSAILMHSSSQKRTVRSLERDVGCRFEFISPPTVGDVLEASADQVVSTLNGVHPESIKFFSATAQKLHEEKGTDALAAALAHLSGFSQPPSSRSLLSHEQGWVTLQLIRDSTNSRGFLSERSVTGFLSDVYGPAADEVGKIFLIADERVQGAVFDLPEDIAKDLLEKEMPEGNSVSMITKLPPLQDDGPSSDNYGRFSSRDRMPRGGGGGSRGSRFGGRGGSSRGRDSWGGDSDRRSRSSGGGGSSWSRGGGSSRGSSDDWLIGGGSDRRSSSRRAPSRERSFGGACFNCGSSGHRAADCPDKRGF